MLKYGAYFISLPFLVRCEAEVGNVALLQSSLVRWYVVLAFMLGPGVIDPIAGSFSGPGGWQAGHNDRARL